MVCAQVGTGGAYHRYQGPAAPAPPEPKRPPKLLRLLRRGQVGTPLGGYGEGEIALQTLFRLALQTLFRLARDGQIAVAVPRMP